MLNNQTSEGGNTTNFTVALTSEPLSNVTVFVTVDSVTNNGYTRVEAVPVGGTYMVSRWASPTHSALLSPPLITSDYLLSPLTTSHHLSSPLTTSHCLSPPLTTSRHFSPLLITPRHLSSLLITSHHFSPPLHGFLHGFLHFSPPLTRPPPLCRTSVPSSLPRLTAAAASYESTAPWMTGGVDTVLNPSNGFLALTFDPSNWSVPQTVTLLGLDDMVDDGDQSVLVSIDAASSNADPLYASTNLPTVTVPIVNTDNDEVRRLSSALQRTPPPPPSPLIPPPLFFKPPQGSHSHLVFLPPLPPLRKGWIRGRGAVERMFGAVPGQGR